MYGRIFGFQRLVVPEMHAGFENVFDDDFRHAADS